MYIRINLNTCIIYINAMTSEIPSKRLFPESTICVSNVAMHNLLQTVIIIEQENIRKR